ncbi:MAG: hypothetical protein Q7U66_00395 [Methylobacter sp.]|nr:hypothetical protein [Methylobacter sp.]
MSLEEFSYPRKTRNTRKYSYRQVGRNKAIQARSARWRFRQIQMLAGNANSRYRSNQLIPAYLVFGGENAGSPGKLRSIFLPTTSLFCFVSFVSFVEKLLF